MCPHWTSWVQVALLRDLNPAYQKILVRWRRIAAGQTLPPCSKFLSGRRGRNGINVIVHGDADCLLF